MDNYTLLMMIECLIDDIESCFDIDDVNTRIIYENKKESTLFEFLKTNGSDGCVGLYTFYANYLIIKRRLKLIKELPSITNQQIPDLKVINRPEIPNFDDDENVPF